MDELLRLVPTVGYGDDAPADRRGGALHLSAVLPALSAAIGHPAPTKLHAVPRHASARWGCPMPNRPSWCSWTAWATGTSPCASATAPLSAFADERKRQISVPSPPALQAPLWRPWPAFGTGTCPGLTAMAGYTQLEPASHKLSNSSSSKTRWHPNQPIRTFLCRPWSIRSTCSARRRCSRNLRLEEVRGHELGVAQILQIAIDRSRIARHRLSRQRHPTRSCAGRRTRLPHPRPDLPVHP